MKRYKKSKARKKLARSFNSLKVIAITGSFGKTTTKQFIYELVRHKYTTQVVPGNINTAIGISMWILNMLEPETEVVVVEMGAYIPGEIADSVSIIPPDIAVITTLADQHLEQFGSFNNLISAKLEIWEGDSIKIINSNFSKFLPDLDYNYQEVNTKTTPEINDKRLEYSLTSASATENINLALAVAKVMNIPERFIIDTVSKLETPDRRFKEREWGGFSAIDDSYNISFESGKSALIKARQIADSKGHRLCVITAGIPELGIENKNANFDYGVALGTNVDISIILNSIFKDELINGIKSSNGDPEILTANSIEEAFKILNKYIFPDKLLVLVQPELTDLYY